MGEDANLEFRHINALIRFHLGLDPMSLFTEGPNGELNDAKYVQVWAELEWVLRREQQLRLR